MVFIFPSKDVTNQFFMETSKIQEIAQLFISNPELSSNEVMEGYIFGTYGNSEHYSIDEIQQIKETVLNLTTPVIEEPVIETPVEETPVVVEQTMEEIIEDIL